MLPESQPPTPAALMAALASARVAFADGEAVEGVDGAAFVIGRGLGAEIVAHVFQVSRGLVLSAPLGS